MVVIHDPEEIVMAEGELKKPPFVNANNGLLRAELERLAKNARPMDSRSLGRAGAGLVIKGK